MLSGLAKAYYVTRADAMSASWRTAKTPSTIAWLGLHRVGWAWPTPFELRDYQGNAYSLFDFSPNTIRHLLHRARLHALVRQLAKADGLRRVLYELVTRMLRARAFSA